MQSWIEDCFDQLREPSCCTSKNNQHYELFLKLFILVGRPTLEDDILYFVRSDTTDYNEPVTIRRIPEDHRIPSLDFVPNWKETLFLNIVSRLGYRLSIELISATGQVKMENSWQVFASPSESKPKETDEMVREKKYNINWTFPLINFSVQEAAGSGSKRIPLQRDDRLRISIIAGSTNIFTDEITFGMVSSEFHKVYSRRKHITPDLNSEQMVRLKRADKALVSINVMPFFLEDVRMGVRSAIYSLFLKRYPHTPSRFLCRPLSVSVHWSTIIDALLKSRIKEL